MFRDVFNWLTYYRSRRLNRASLRLLMVEITQRCNNRCIMCSAWRRKPLPDMPLEDLEKILANSSFPDLRSFCLMGGETYLYGPLVDAVALVNKRFPSVRLFTSSNCYAVDTVVEKAVAMNKIMPLEFCASLDGDEETHNRIRGMNDSYGRVWETIDRLRSHGITPFLSFTITPDNYDQIVSTYNLAQENGLNMSCRPAGCGVYFDNRDQSPDNLRLTPDQIDAVVDQLRAIQYAEHYLHYGVEHFLLHQHRLFPCGGGYFSAFINLAQDVFPGTHCPAEWAMGNLADFGYSLDRLLASDTACETRRNKVDTCSACINDVEYCATYGMQQIAVSWWLLRRNPGKFFQAAAQLLRTGR